MTFGYRDKFARPESVNTTLTPDDLDDHTPADDTDQGFQALQGAADQGDQVEPAPAPEAQA